MRGTATRLFSRIAWMLAGVLALQLDVESSAVAEAPLPSPSSVEAYLRLNSERLHNRGATIAHDFVVDEVRPSSLDGLFSRHRLFEACARGPVLEAGPIRSTSPFGSCGFFATDGTKISYLNRDNQWNLEEILRREETSLERVDAPLLSEFLSAVLLRNRSDSQTIIYSASEVLAIAKSRPGYTIDEAERGRYEGRVHAPKITGTRVTGWSLEFFTLSGGVGQERAVARQRFEISPKYEIRWHEEMLTRQAFSSSPHIVY